MSIIGGKGAGLLKGGGDFQIGNTSTSNDDVKLELAQVGGNIAIGDTFKIVEAGGEIRGDIGNTSVTSRDGKYEFEIELRDANDVVIPNTVAEYLPYKTIWLRTVRSPAFVAAGVVPEPSTYALCGALASLAFAFYRRHRRKKGSN